MKKLFVFLLGIGLLNNSLMALSPLRTWKCRPTNPHSSCSQAEKDAARKTFATATKATLGTLAAILATFGISVAAYQLSKEKEAATTPRPTMEESARKIREAQEQLAGIEPLPTKEELEQQAREAVLRKAEETEARIGKIRGY